VRDVAAGKATIGVLPLMGEGGWWRALAKNTAVPRIVAKLPFAGGKGDAVAIARVPFEPSGSDRSLIMAESRPRLGRAAIVAAFRKAGLAGRVIGEDGSATLVEVDDFVAEGDARLASLRFNRAALIGGYATPLSKG